MLWLGRYYTANSVSIYAVMPHRVAMRLPCLLDSHDGDPYTPSLAQAAIRVRFSPSGLDLLGVFDA